LHSNLKKRRKMKKKYVFLIVLAILAFNLVFCVFYFRGAMNERKYLEKERELADFYREVAVEYVKADPEMIRKYGDDFDVELDFAFSIALDDDRGAIAHLFQRLSGKYIPKNLNEFNENTKNLWFYFSIGEEQYSVVLNKDENGTLVPCGIEKENEK